MRMRQIIDHVIDGTSFDWFRKIGRVENHLSKKFKTCSSWLQSWEIYYCSGPWPISVRTSKITDLNKFWLVSKLNRKIILGQFLNCNFINWQTDFYSLNLKFVQFQNPFSLICVLLFIKSICNMNYMFVRTFKYPILKISIHSFT